MCFSAAGLPVHVQNAGFLLSFYFSHSAAKFILLKISVSLNCEVCMGFGVTFDGIICCLFARSSCHQ